MIQDVIQMKQETFQTGMYIIDENYTIVNCNRALHEMYPHVREGQLCYQALALQESPCEICPLKMDNSLFYNPLRKEWIYANAAAMEYPGHGQCYNVQFQIRQRLEGSGQSQMQKEGMEEYILQLSGGNPDVCAIGGYCEPGSPLAYANDRMVQLLGYDSLEAMYAAADGMVSNTIHPDDLERVTRDLTRAALQGGQFETTYQMQRADRSWFWVVNRGMRVEDKSGAFLLLSVITDMTEFIQKQGQLKKQNEQLLQKELTSQQVLEKMPGGYHRCAAEPGFPLTYYGASFEKITGWTRQEIEEEFQNLFLNMVYPEDIPICASIVLDIDEKGYSNAIYRFKKKDGGYIWVSDSTVRVDLGQNTFYHGVIADVTEQINELEQARQIAEQSSHAKSTFLFNASHDIRTPMNAIQGFAYIIQENAGNEAVVSENIRKILQSGNTLMTLLNDVLELSRIERGKEELRSQYVNLYKLGKDLYEMFRSEMENAELNFQIEKGIRHYHVLCDRLKLTRIGMNLLSNARKFTPAGGTVVFGAEELESDGKTVTCRFYTRDTGIGMSQEFQQRAFEQFERERNTTNSGIHGSGLGLSIIKKLVELMDGSYEIKSEIGQGTEVSVTLTFPMADPETLEKATVVSKPEDLTGKRVLLVEDNTFNREIARYMLEALGMEVEEAEDGAECLEELRKAPADHYDLVLMDLQMPVMDGYTATGMIRTLPDARRAAVPIIAMTANAFEEDKQRCLEAGMNGHIGKPIEPEVLRREIAKVLR